MSLVRYVLLAAGLAMAGCSVVALPFHVTADVVSVVPVVGGPASTPFEAVGDTID